VDTRVLDRNSLAAGDIIPGPCIVERLDTTVVLPPDTTSLVDEVGHIVVTLLERKEKP
jgi:N-methylhydantoinase A